jgi:hypothetical protein
VPIRPYADDAAPQPDYFLEFRVILHNLQFLLEKKNLYYKTVVMQVSNVFNTRTVTSVRIFECTVPVGTQETVGKQDLF